MNRELEEIYIDILKKELAPAMGCTEPIAVAYAGAIARETLGQLPQRVELVVSSNIVKNVKSVIVPHTNGRKGLHTAVAAGICCGSADNGLQVLADITEEQEKLLDDFLNHVDIQVKESDSGCVFDVTVTAEIGYKEACVRIAGNHTNVVLIRKNGETIFEKPYEGDEGVENTIRAVSKIARDGMKETDEEIVRLMVHPQG